MAPVRAFEFSNSPQLLALEKLTSTSESRLTQIIERNESSLLAAWLEILDAGGNYRKDSVAGRQIHESAGTFLSALRSALVDENSTDLSRPEWARMHDLLSALAQEKAEQGSTPTEIAEFVFSLKQPLFSLLRREYSAHAGGLADETWRATVIIDKLGLKTTEIFQKSREEIIRRQQRELLELSTPVVKLWENVLALPLIGTLDSARAQVVMQNLLEAVVAHGAAIAIIDITGVPTVDTLFAQHLLKTVAAARLMGADCIISGIRPQIAQTMIHLGLNLADVSTKSTLADAFQLALKKLGVALAAPPKKLQQVGA